MQAVDPHARSSSTGSRRPAIGYGGDPINVTYLNMSKGRLYDFRASYRRYRQYFDYDLLANPLIPPAVDPVCSLAESPAPL